jgi:eukaryotic-like serine/threonine-protein kinase
MAIGAAMDKDFLLGVLAVQLGFATSAEVMAAASAWLADRSSSIPERLEATGALDATKRQMLESFVAEALKHHEGDVHETLSSLGGEQVLLRSFGGSVVSDGRGGVEVTSQGDSEGGDKSESTLVSQEQSGRYVLRGGSEDEAEIGRGGLGRVLVAYDEHLGRDVAIKELLADAGTGSTKSQGGSGSRTSPLVARFLREARVTGQLEHPNIVPVHEVGQRRDGTYFYTMRVVRGSTLGERLQGCGTLAERLKLLPHYIDLCNAIAYAHSRGVVHRDVKPNNVMIGEFGETVVLDWGLAKVRGMRDIRGRAIAREVKILHDAGAGHTVDGSAVGTPAYMSPEQADGRIADIDERSDVWGLGAVLYEMLTGHPPFEGVTPFEILGKVLKDNVAPVRSQCAEAPAELAAVAEKALRHDPQQRYSGAKELAEEVDNYLQGRRVGAYAYSSTELLRRFIEKNKALSGGIALVLATLMVSSLVIWLAYGREQAARAAAESQKAEAIEQRREATSNLGNAHVSAAEHLLSKRHYAGALVYATAALREYQRSELPMTQPQRVALESVLYESRARRMLNLRQTLPGPDGPVYEMQLSKDGRLLALSDAKGELWLHHLDGSRPPIRRLLNVICTSLRFSNDGKTLLAGFTDGVLRTYDLSDLRKLREEPTPAKSASHWSFSPDERRVVVTDSGQTAWLLDRKAPEQAISLGPSAGASISPDGSQVARCAPGAVVIHDATTGATRSEFKMPEPFVGGCYFSSNGSRILVSMLGGARVLDLGQKKVVGHMSPDYAGSVACTATPDGRWLLSPQTGVLLWDGESSSPSQVLWVGSQRVRTAISSDGRHVVFGDQGTVRVFDVRENDAVSSAPSSSFALFASFSPDSRLAVFSDAGGNVRLVDFDDHAKSAVIDTLPPTRSTLTYTALAFSRGGREVVTVDGEQVLKVTDVQSRTLLRSRRLMHMKWGMDQWPRLAFLPRGRQLAVTQPDGRLFLVDYATLDIVRALTTNLFRPQAMNVSLDGRFLVLGDMNGQIAVFGRASWELLHLYATDAGSVSDLVVTRDGKTIVTAGMDGWMRWFDLESGRTIRAQHAHEAWVNRIALSPDGERLLTGSDDRTAKLWDTASGELLRIVRFDELVAAVAFSPDGKRLAMSGNGAVFFFPDHRDVLQGDADELMSEAVATTGLELRGASLVPREDRTEPEEVQPVDAGEPPPGQLRGKLRDFFYPQKTLAEGATIALIQMDDGSPLSPPVEARTDANGAFALLLPEGMERCAAKITLGSETTYTYGGPCRRGKRPRGLTLFPMTELVSVAKSVGVSVSPDKGQVVGSVKWVPQDELTPTTVGCAQVNLDGSESVFYAAPSATSAAHPSKDLRLLHPGAPIFYAFNLDPGVHKLEARVGDNVVETTVRVHAGAVSFKVVEFDEERFPKNPTPDLCFADWPPESKEGE